MQRDRFVGRIFGIGTSSGTRLVVGDWTRSPLGRFADVMVARPGGERILLAPSSETRDYIAQTYRFDRVELVQVSVTEPAPGQVQVSAGPLSLRMTVGGRTVLGHLLRAIPAQVSCSPTFARAADPIARIALRGVRTRGSAGNGRQEFYGAREVRAIVDAAADWDGEDLGGLADVWPPPDFGFSSTPRKPCVTQVTTTVLVP